MKSQIANVLDTEWSCYENGLFPEGESPEIIEFGLCMVDLKLRQIIQRISLPVIPTRSKISPFCTQLTGWTYAKLKKQGMSMTEACRRLSEKYGARNRLLVVDTDDELVNINKQCQDMGLSSAFGLVTLNVSTLFALTCREQANLGLPAMLQKCGMTFEGRLHTGYDDSHNIARLFLHLLSGFSCIS